MAYLHTGARKEELLPGRLTWDKVDFQNEMITLTISPVRCCLYRALEKRAAERTRTSTSCDTGS